MVVFPTPQLLLRPSGRLRNFFHRRDLAAAAVGAFLTCLLFTTWSLAAFPAAPAVSLPGAEARPTAAAGASMAAPGVTAAAGGSVGSGLPSLRPTPGSPVEEQATAPPSTPSSSTEASAKTAAAAADSGGGGGGGVSESHGESMALAGQTTPEAGGDGSGGLWMTPAEARLISAAMWPGMRYLEYGSGGSTRRFGGLASVAYSIEHDADWCRQMEPTLRGTPIRMVCVPVARAPAGSGGWGSRTPFDAANYTTFRDYVRAPGSLPPSTYDVVLIDGRARVACALYILRRLSRSSVVILHDANRKRYAPVSTYYEEVGRVTSGKGAVVLRPRQQYAGAALSDETIVRVYEKIDKMRQGWKKSK
ncbi:hypothetical protein MMPV_007930 [Pyropia vietnamensis]